jgi:acylpyruvate hydrolase|tara:strand:+ start:103774 stop:104382 length:609 start_codon:yes stop_codon:yes gene_type:complete
MKIFCIGRNYSEHAKEMKAELPSAPIFFMKPDTAILKGSRFYIPKFTNDLHYECELVVKINRVGKNIDEKFAHKYYDEIGLGIDFTARDLQQQCKEKGLPWEIAKAWETSAPLGKDFINKADLNLSKISFKLDKNGETVQKGDSSDMLFSIDKLIAYLSQFHTLKKGDLIFTGTPSGVGPVKIGDELIGYLEDKEMFKLSIR